MLFLLSISLVSGELFLLYDGNTYTAKKVFNPYLQEAVFSPSYELQQEAEEDNSESGQIEIIITKEGFVPEKIEIKRNQTIVWKNGRETLPALIMGMREISMVKRSLQPGESFSRVFSDPGKYFYVDGIIIGYSGEIVVEH